MNEESIIRKIKKCLALASSDSASEAAAALTKAQALMAQYGITQDDVDVSDVESTISSAVRVKTLPGYLNFLSGMLSGVFGCEAVFESRSDLTGGWKTRVRFIGFGSNPEIAVYAFEVLRKRLESDRKAYMQTLRKGTATSTKTRKGDVFAQAWVHAAQEKAQVLVVPGERKDLIQKWMSGTYKEMITEANPKLRKACNRDVAAIRAGLELGRSVRLPPVYPCVRDR